MTLIRMMELPDGFLAVDPDLWEDRDDYNQDAEAVESLKVVSDHAECGVALLQDYSDEAQLQYLLQVVDYYRRVYPDSRKQTLSWLPWKQ